MKITYDPELGKFFKHHVYFDNEYMDVVVYNQANALVIAQLVCVAIIILGVFL